MNASPIRKPVTPAVAQAVDVGARRDARFGHEQPAGRQSIEQAQRRLEPRLERAQVAVVDAEDRTRRIGSASVTRSARAARRRRALRAARPCRVRWRRCASDCNRASSSAATISSTQSAPIARDSNNWYGSTTKSLRRTGRRARGARGDQRVGRPLEIIAVGQHRQAGRALPRFVGTRDRGGIEVGAQQAFRRRSLLDLRDHRGTTDRGAGRQRGRESRAARRPARPAFQSRRAVARRRARATSSRFVDEDALEDVRHQVAALRRLHERVEPRVPRRSRRPRVPRAMPVLDRVTDIGRIEREARVQHDDLARCVPSTSASASSIIAFDSARVRSP